jgi:hypothetical protein
LLKLLMIREETIVSNEGEDVTLSPGIYIAEVVAAQHCCPFDAPIGGHASQATTGSGLPVYQ